MKNKQVNKKSLSPFPHNMDLYYASFFHTNKCVIKYKSMNMFGRNQGTDISQNRTEKII